jgi:hypothetical protein
VIAIFRQHGFDDAAEIGHIEAGPPQLQMR